jgi:hypothetical protein
MLPDSMESLPQAMNAFLPAGIRIASVRPIQGFTGMKFPSLSSVHWGSTFLLTGSCIKANAAEISDKLLMLMNDKVELSSFSLVLGDDKESIQILLPFTGRRELGLSSLFEAAIGTTIRNSAVQVRRLAQYARASDGNPISYSHFYGIA